MFLLISQSTWEEENAYKNVEKYSSIIKILYKTHIHVNIRQQLFNLLSPSDAVRHVIWVNIGSGNGVSHEGTKPSPKPMLTSH